MRNTDASKHINTRLNTLSCTLKSSTTLSTHKKKYCAFHEQIFSGRCSQSKKRKSLQCKSSLWAMQITRRPVDVKTQTNETQRAPLICVGFFFSVFFFIHSGSLAARVKISKASPRRPSASVEKKPKKNKRSLYNTAPHLYNPLCVSKRRTL